MELYEAIDSIRLKLDDMGSKMNEVEESVLKANLDDSEAVCFYALGLLMNSSCRYNKMFFKGYDELQNKALKLLEDAIENGNLLALYIMGEIKCGLFGKFPRNPNEGKVYFEKYYSLTKSESVKADILDNWNDFDNEMRLSFDDKLIYENMTDLRNRGFTDFSSHDEAFYEDNLDKEDKNE